eukprot:m.40180 g.40180  ORF g.40180 m.40180 type:complete len:226 (+) comp11855_c0_seq1:114-791(+)
MSASTRLGGLVTDEGINLDMLERTLQGALRDEARYKRENDAKFRAVAQKVQSYEEFENIVKASHLKAVKEDVTNLSLGRSAWKPSAARRSDDDENKAPAPTAPTTSADDKPATLQQFLRAWRALSSTSDRFQLLCRVGGPQLHTFFKIESIGTVLPDMLRVLSEHVTADSVEIVAEIIDSIAQTYRFSLTVEFLTDAERSVGKALLDKLGSRADSLRPEALLLRE